MNIKQKIAITLGLILSVALVPSVVVFAEDGCGGVKTAIIKCTQDGKGGKVENSGIWGILLIVLNILTAGAGIVAVGGLVYAGILYASAGDEAAKVTKAKETIFNVVVGLVSFGLMWAALQFLIPGGIFK